MVKTKKRIQKKVIYKNLMNNQVMTHLMKVPKTSNNLGNPRKNKMMIRRSNRKSQIQRLKVEKEKRKDKAKEKLVKRRMMIKKTINKKKNEKNKQKKMTKNLAIKVRNLK